jgi:hypothetical protein
VWSRGARSWLCLPQKPASAIGLMEARCIEACRRCGPLAHSA